MHKFIASGLIGAFVACATTLWSTSESSSTYEQRLASLEAAFAERPTSTPPAEVIEERVLDLPEDGNQWHTILILRTGWQSSSAERRAEAMFQSEPLLVSLKHQTHWHLITTDQAEFQKFRPLVDATPCLLVERANGQVVYRESGPDLGKRPHALTRSIRQEIQRHCPDGRCLPLHPVPDKDEPPSKDEIPSVLREEEPAAKKPSVVPLVMVSALGGLLGFAHKFRAAAGV